MSIKRIRLEKDAESNRIILSDGDSSREEALKHPSIHSRSYFLSIPMDIAMQVMKVFGIRTMFEWQTDFLLKAGSPQGQRKNWFISMPTSAGKSLPCFILMLRSFLVKKKDVICVVPYVSLAEDKIVELQEHATNLDFVVESYVGGRGVTPPPIRSTSRTVYVATMEKFFLLIQSLYMEDRLEEIGLVIIDELHMLNEEERGAALEMPLIKLLHYNSQRENNMHPFQVSVGVPAEFNADSAAGASLNKDPIQIVGLSATVSNSADICRFLKAEHYEGHFRPVELQEFIVLGCKMYKVQRANSASLTFSKLLTTYQDRDLTPLHFLVKQNLRSGISCLIFCSLRSRAEKIAAELSKMMLKSTNSQEEDGAILLQRESLAQALQVECKLTTSNQDLTAIIQTGIMYHHAGLTSCQRRLLEDAFRTRTVPILCCTSTLSAGVNLPAERVIVLDLTIGSEPIDKSRYLQMAGRAGRAGLSNIGECIIFVPNGSSSKEEILKKFFIDPILPVSSRMNDISMERLLLLHLAKPEHQVAHLDLRCLVEFSLHYIQSDGGHDSSTIRMFESCLQNLISKGLVISMENDSLLKLTNLGIVAVKGIFSSKYLPSELALDSLQSLEDANKSLSLQSDLQLLYLCVLHKGVVKENYSLCFWTLDKTVASLPECEKTVIQYLLDRELCHNNHTGSKVKSMTVEHFLGLMLRCQPPQGSWRYKFCIRIFLAIQFCKFLKEECTLEEVSVIINMPYATTVSVLELLCANAMALCRVCSTVPKMWGLKLLLAGLNEKLKPPIDPQIEKLTLLPGIGRYRAEKLFKMGLKTLFDIANASPDHICSVLQNIQQAAQKIVSSAMAILQTSTDDAVDLLKKIYKQ